MNDFPNDWVFAFLRRATLIRHSLAGGAAQEFAVK